MGGSAGRIRFDDAFSDAYTSICRRTTRLQTPLLGIGILTALNWDDKIKGRHDFVMHCSHGSNWGDAKSGTTSGMFPYAAFELFKKNDAMFSSVFACFISRD